MAAPCICLYFSYLFLFRKVKIKQVVAQLNSNINSIQNAKVSKSGDVISGILKIKRINGTTGNDWSTAALCIEGLTNQNQYSRAGISFENTGTNACILYLDVDGSLKVVDHGGKTKTIQMV